MNILVTGGMGFIGSHISERLLNEGYNVTIVDNLSTGSLDNISHLNGNSRLQTHIGSVRDKALMERLLQDADTCFHFAAVVGVRSVLNDPLLCLDVNIRGTDMLLELANKHDVKVLLASSSEVYGKGLNGILSENSNRILGPTTVTRWVYATTKAVDECLAMSYWREKQLPVVIMRLFNTVGPRQSSQYGMVLPTFVQQALSGQPITVYGDGKQVRSFTFVSDAVRAAVALSKCPEAVGEVFNIGGAEPVSIAALAQRVKDLTQSNSPIKYVPYEEAYGHGFEDSVVRVPDISRLRAVIGYEPECSLDDMIRHTIDYFKSQKRSLGNETSEVSSVSLDSLPALEEDQCRGR